MEREFRGKLLKIRVDNSNGIQKGVQKMILNGEELEENLIPVGKMNDQNEVLVLMGVD